VVVLTGIRLVWPSRWRLFEAHTAWRQPPCCPDVTRGACPLWDASQGQSQFFRCPAWCQCSLCLIRQQLIGIYLSSN